MEGGEGRKRGIEEEENWRGEKEGRRRGTNEKWIGGNDRCVRGWRKGREVWEGNQKM